jgi:hypothetical protein
MSDQQPPARPQAAQAGQPSESASSRPSDFAELAPSMASSSEVTSASQTDEQFIDDLVAANRFKTFLVGRGADVPPEVSKGLAQLVSQFADEIAEFDQSWKPLLGKLSPPATATSQKKAR